MSSPDDFNGRPSAQLTGWKEIAAYIGKGVRQAQRWEKLGMPVHRVAGMDGVVYAYPEEIDKWRGSSAGQDAESTDAARLSALPAAAPDVATEPGESRVHPPAARRGRVLAPVAGIAIFMFLGLGGYRYYAPPTMSIVLSSPAEAGQGGSFRFTASGGDEALNLTYRILRNPRGGEHVVSPPVPREADGRFIWVLSTDCQTPPGQHKVSLADSAGRSLTKEITVTVRENPACRGAVPDLQAEVITLARDRVQAGERFQCRLVLRNQGAGAAHPSMTRLRLSRSPMRSSVSDVRLGDVPTPLLHPGEEAVLESWVMIPTDVEAGVYYIWVVADNNSDNVESFTHNNYVKSVPLTVEPAKKPQ